MKINSASAEAIGYGSDAVKAFNQAVENGQARLALYVLVDIVDVLIEKIEQLEQASSQEEEVVEIKKEVAQEQKPLVEEVKAQPKAKAPVKETASE